MAVEKGTGCSTRFRSSIGFYKDEDESSQEKREAKGEETAGANSISLSSFLSIDAQFSGIFWLE